MAYLKYIVCAFAYAALSNANAIHDQDETPNVMVHDDNQASLNDNEKKSHSVEASSIRNEKESNEFGPETPEFWVSENESSDSRLDLSTKTDSTDNKLQMDTTFNESAQTNSENLTNETVTGIAVHNSSEKNSTESKLRCVLKVLPEGEEPTIHLLNTSALLKALTPVPNVTSGECALVMFYSPWCPFSAKAAPHFNALPRLYPHFSFYALDAVSYNALNMRYGLVALPSVLLFHNGKGIVKYNESEPVLDKLISFIQKYTGTGPQGNASVLDEDIIGPISSVPLEKTDYLLILSWVFTVTCAGGWFMKSSLFHRIVESVRNAWREAEAQHEHQE